MEEIKNIIKPRVIDDGVVVYFENFPKARGWYYEGKKDINVDVGKASWRVKFKKYLDSCSIPYTLEYGSIYTIPTKYLEIINELEEMNEFKNIPLKNLLLETTHIFEMEVIIITDYNYNRVEIYNRIRALRGVVVLTVEKNSFLDSKSDTKKEYSLIHIKYIVSKDPLADMQKIKVDALITSKIHGLLQFIPRPKTAVKKGTY
jgi:phosphopantetheine adenylyltransferase